MGFGLGDIGSFALGGPVGYAAYKAFSGNGSTGVSQIPLMDPAQAEARRNLLEFSKTGKLGDYTAGTPYAGSLGDFGISALEQGGLNRIGANAIGGPGQMFDLGASTLQDLLGSDKYNPLNQSGMIQGLTGAIDYNTKKAVDAAKRDAGYTGSLYSTNAVRNLGNVEAQGANQKAVTLAGLYQNYLGQKLGAIPQAFGAQAQLDQKGQTQFQNEFTYGAVPRNLKTAEDQARYAEFQRQQQEKQGQVTAATNLAGSNVPFGVPNVSIPNANPWMDVLSLLAQFGGKAAGTALAA